MLVLCLEPSNHLNKSSNREQYAKSSNLMSYNLKGLVFYLIVFMGLQLVLLVFIILNWESFQFELTHLRNTFEKCKCWKSSYLSKKTKEATIQLDPNKFIYPYPPWGPNNQMGAFINAVYISIRLNR